MTDDADFTPRMPAVCVECPCDDCVNAPRCASLKMACSQFNAWMWGRGAWRRKPRVPNRQMYRWCFEKGRNA